MRDFSADHRWLSINTATVRKSRGVDLPLPEIASFLELYCHMTV